MRKNHCQVIKHDCNSRGRTTKPSARRQPPALGALLSGIDPLNLDKVQTFPSWAGILFSQLHVFAFRKRQEAPIRCFIEAIRSTMLKAKHDLSETCLLDREIPSGSAYKPCGITFHRPSRTSDNAGVTVADDVSVSRVREVTDDFRCRVIQLDHLEAR